MNEAAQLGLAMQGWPRPVFMTVDGSLLRDAPDVLRRADVVVRSLYMEHPNPAAVRAGPWFAALDQRHLDNVLRIEGIGGWAVFWGGAVDEAVVYRHLRSINLADLPRPRDAPFERFAADPETVMFRHADPSVLALVLPVLEAGQRARLFGPMSGIVLAASTIGGIREARRRRDWPEAPRGRLLLSQTQLDRIAEAMAERSRRKVAGFLRDAAPAHAARMDEPGLMAFVAETETSGRALGLTTERGLGRWAYLMLVSQGGIAGSAPARRWIANGVGTPDERIGQLLLGIAGALHRAEVGT